MSVDEDKLYKLSELTALTGIPHSTLRLYARSGELKTSRIGKLWRVKGSDAIELLNQRQVGCPEKDVMRRIDLTDIECRIADLVQDVAGKPLKEEQREKLLNILNDFMRAALERKTPKPEPTPDEPKPKRKPIKL